jgi:hypothetical protein
MHHDATDCVRKSMVSQMDKPIPLPIEVVRWIDKGRAPFAGWSLDAAGPFPEDGDRNWYLIVAIDPFSKWVEVTPVP